MLAILFNQLVNSALGHELEIPIQSNSQCEILVRIQNEGMRTILDITRNTPLATMRYMLGWSSISLSYMLAQFNAYMEYFFVLFLFHPFFKSHNVSVIYTQVQNSVFLLFSMMFL